jgi:hypothetical protein
MALIDKPALTETETREYYETTMRDALRVGLTSIHDASSFPKDIGFFQRHVLLLVRPCIDMRLHLIGWPMRGVYR